MPKRQCVFNEKLQNDFNFIIKFQKLGLEKKVECTVFDAVFSIIHGEKSKINQHIKTDRHEIEINAHKFQKVKDYFCIKTFNKNQKHLVANQGVFVRHLCIYNQNIRLVNCTVSCRKTKLLK